LRRSNRRHASAALLEERFHLKSHRESGSSRSTRSKRCRRSRFLLFRPMRPRETFSRSRARAGPAGATVDLGDGAALIVASNRIEVRRATFAQVAATLERFVDRPAVDRSRREGRFDIAVDLTREDPSGARPRVSSTPLRSDLTTFQAAPNDLTFESR
jgi:uncharacterized protein (TIGR03435 family)